MNEEKNNEKGISEKRKLRENEINLAVKKLRKSPIRSHGMPAELLNEMFASLPLVIAFGLLAKIPNGLLARNLQKMFKAIKEEMKGNKWNLGDCSPNLTILEDLFVADYSGLPGFNFNCVRAILPIPLNLTLSAKKSFIAFYFEIQIIKIWKDINIGFCDQQFPLEDKWLGDENNSIGICCKKYIMIDKYHLVIGNADENFKEGDVVGVGIIRSLTNASIKCFATLNGELLGMAKLPAKYATLQIFPAVQLSRNGDSINANFGKKEWHFKQFKKVLQNCANDYIHDIIYI